MVAPFNYNPIRNTGISLIKQFGRPCNLLRPTEATPPDPSKPWRVGDGTTATIPFRGVATAVRFPRLSDPIVDQTDTEILMPGDAGVEPTVNDRVQIIGVYLGEVNPQFQIIGVHTINPDGTAIMYTLRCRAWQGIIQAAGEPV